MYLFTYLYLYMCVYVHVHDYLSVNHTCVKIIGQLESVLSFHMWVVDIKLMSLGLATLSEQETYFTMERM